MYRCVPATACRAIHAGGAACRSARIVKTRIARDLAIVRRPGRPIPAAMGTAGAAQAEAGRARIRTVLRAPSDWRAPAPVPRLSALKVGAVNDPLEHDANRIADQVMQEKVQKQSTALDVGDRRAPESVRGRCARRGNHWTHRLGAISNRASDTTSAGCGCILTRAPRNQHAISTPAPTPWETTLSLAPAGSRRGRPRGGSCSPTSWRMSCRTLPQGAADTIRRTPDPPPEPPAKIISRVWNVEGRPVVVVEFDGRRKAFYERRWQARLDRKAMPVRRRAIGRPSMDGSRARKLKAQGISLRKTIIGVSSPRIRSTAMAMKRTSRLPSGSASRNSSVRRRSSPGRRCKPSWKNWA